MASRLIQKMSTISILAPPRGATIRILHACYILAKFQFSPLREGRRYIQVKIVTPDNYFNSRPSARGDMESVSFYSFPRSFQFSPLREGRQAYAGQLHPWSDYFNSRPSARGDCVSTRSKRRSIVFQFSPLREGRPDVSASPLAPEDVFQFSPLREGRRYIQAKAVTPDNYFNSRPSARGDLSSPNKESIIAPFQFSPLREGRELKWSYY